MYVEYSSNNSGGYWWLEDEDWKALEAAGWKVVWASMIHALTKDERMYKRDADGTPALIPVEQSTSKLGFPGLRKEKGVWRWIGALAKSAYRAGLSLREAVEEWERITGKSALEIRCACCGPPHYFTEYDDSGHFVKAGPNVVSEARW